MSQSTVNVKLKRGTAAKLARRFKVSEPHISLILKNKRVGRASLMRAIERERLRQAEQDAAA